MVLSGPAKDTLARSEDTETMGACITRLRRERGITQVELAERLQVSQPVVSDYENDVIRLPADTVAQIAEILGASTDELLGLKPPRRRRAGPSKTGASTGACRRSSGCRAATRRRCCARSRRLSPRPVEAESHERTP
jgi:DNA-binding transcriptional regulator YiaG